MHLALSYHSIRIHTWDKNKYNYIRPVYQTTLWYLSLLYVIFEIFEKYTWNSLSFKRPNVQRGLQLEQVEIKLIDGREYCNQRSGPTCRSQLLRFHTDELTFSVICYQSRNKTLQQLQLPWHQRCFFNRSFSLLRLHSSLTRPSVPSFQGASLRAADQSLSQPPPWPRNPLRRRAPSSRTCWRWLALIPAEALEFKLTSRPVAPWVSIVPLSSPLLLLRTPSEYRFVILFSHHVYWLTQLRYKLSVLSYWTL